MKKNATDGTRSNQRESTDNRIFWKKPSLIQLNIKQTNVIRSGPVQGDPTVPPPEEI